MREESKECPCRRLCIDDLCRGNPACTLCFGSYCRDCEELTAGAGVFDECAKCDDDLDWGDEDTLETDGYA